MRIAVIGASGSGKTTLAQQLSCEFSIPHVDIDAINWQPGWRDLATYDPDEFRRCVALAMAPDSWVADGNYFRILGPLVFERATHVVWLDYPRALVMRRVFWRSFLRAVDRKELWPGTGNREGLRDWIKPEHPIRWAWSTYASLRAECESRLARPECAHLRIVRLRHPREARTLAERLRRASPSP